MQNHKTELAAAERRLQSTVGKSTSQGLYAVRRIAQEHGIAGVYGPLIELFQVPQPQFRLPAEVTAGGRLFNVVVANDKTAARIIEIMNREKTPGTVWVLCVVLCVCFILNHHHD